ncbi:hypothetical protein DdX_15854 [Ditylenchus destructor]|uniref:Uncharacterized protein n=1 Tax=Ditylenchus destructor TaxID=166010 RepID=A0AAD4R0G9_9BILA|nr:hypothetical protein DdX_15854 [Ditylenchus destructor]
MWISSSPSKNRSDRGRIDVFFRGLNWILKATLLILALSSFSVAAASDLPESCRDNRETCFAKTSNELEDGWGKYIRIEDGGISWNASGMSKIGLYKNKDNECNKLSFSMDKPTFAESDTNHTDCKFSMHYNKCVMNISLATVDAGDTLSFKDDGKDGGTAGVLRPGSSVKVELEGGELKCNSKKCNQEGDFCGFETQKDGGWCKFNFTLEKTGSCDGTIRFDYKLLATTQAPTTAAPEETTTTQGTAESGLSPWIIVGIVLVVLLLVAGGAGLLVFLICRRKRREPPQNMAEKGNAGIDCQCETAVSSSVVLQTAVSGEKPVSAKVNEPPKNERKDERSKPTSQTEVAKPVSQKKQNVPEPRAKTAVEMNEPKRDPKKAAPMPPSKKKSDKKKDEAKNQILAIRQESMPSIYRICPFVKL